MKENNNVKITLFICITIFLCALIITSNSKVSAEGKIMCDSGFIGVDIETYEVQQKVPCDKMPNSNYDGNFTCYKKDTLTKHMNLKDIKNINCEIEYSGKIPKSLISFFDMLK